MWTARSTSRPSTSSSRRCSPRRRTTSASSSPTPITPGNGRDMALNLDIVGQKSDAHPVSWTSSQALLYALGVGAGTDESLDELPFVTENTEGVGQEVLPTFPVVLGYG